MPATSRILTLCDALVTAIDTAWTQGASDTISRRYIAPIATNELHTLTGRHIYVFPGPYSDEPADRGRDLFRHEIGLIIVERYESLGGDPADTTLRTWVDTRVDFVESTVIAAIDFDGRGAAGVLEIGSTRNVMTESIEVLTYDEEILNEKKTFLSRLTVNFLDYTVG